MSSPGLTADLHVHSRYSKRPAQWILQKINCPECFSDPRRIYALAQDRGMDLVTITDHNSIEGALEIAHLPGVFISEEVTTYFPQDGCKIHVLTLNISEKQHRDIQHLRQNIFDLVSYLRDQSILYIVAHPFYDMNNRLHIEHFEQMLLLFDLFELNGSRDKVQNHILKQILAALTANDIELLADKHSLQPAGEKPWVKTLTAGSDDHSSLNIARAYTRVPGAVEVQDFMQGLRQGRAEPHSQPASARTMGHNLYAIAYQFYKDKFNLDRYVQKDELLQFVDCALTGRTGNNKGFWNWLYDYLGTKRGGWSCFKISGSSDVTSMIHQEGRAILNNNPHLLGMIHDPDRTFQDRENDWFNFVRAASDRMIKNFSQTLVESASQARLFNIFATIGSGGSVYALLAPYFLAFGLYSKDRPLAQACLERLQGSQSVSHSKSPKVALFTDTFDQCNGVALTLQNQALLAKDLHKNLHILTCGSKLTMDKQIDFAPFGQIEVPEYAELDLACPSFLEILDFCADNDFTHIHTSTPGPMGLAALATARILHLPIYGTYHTSFPQYASELTGDPDMESLMWKLMTWYYNQLDKIYVPSRATGDELTAHGIQSDKIRLYPRGIDTRRFHPQHKNGFWEKRFGLRRDRLKLLYVGRISKEKNLQTLARAYAQISKARSDIQLIIVGSGPFLSQMQDDLSGTQAVFAGTLTGQDLAQAYASSDIFVFPSTTDTFGNVVLEAQASGLPVIVTDQGGPQENLIPKQTGLIVPALNVQALVQAILTLAGDPQRLEKMKVQARQYMQERSTQEAFVQSWEMYEDKAQNIEGRTIFQAHTKFHQIVIHES